MLDAMAQVFRDDALQVALKRAARAIVTGYHNIDIDTARNIAAVVAFYDDRVTRANEVKAVLKDCDTGCSLRTAFEIQATCRRQGI